MDGAGFVGGKYAAGSGSREKTSAGEETKGEGNMYAAKENQSYPRDDGDEGWVMGSEWQGEGEGAGRGSFDRRPQTGMRSRSGFAEARDEGLVRGTASAQQSFGGSTYSSLRVCVCVCV